MVDDKTGNAYVEFEGERKFLLDDIETDGIETTCQFISSYLLDPTFLVSFQDSKGQQSDTQTVYKLCVLCYSLDLYYKDYFADMLENYDFSLLSSKRDSVLYKNFCELLNEVQSGSSLLVKKREKSKEIKGADSSKGNKKKNDKKPIYYSKNHNIIYDEMLILPSIEMARMTPERKNKFLYLYKIDRLLRFHKIEFRFILKSIISYEVNILMILWINLFQKIAILWTCC